MGDAMDDATILVELLEAAHRRTAYVDVSHARKRVRKR
jgi:hypothetical protein